MTELNIKPTPSTPSISFSKEKAYLEIGGKSMAENASDFFEPVLEWLTEYRKDPLQPTIMNFKLVYFNTASSKRILDILMLLEEMQEEGNEVIIRWHSMKEDDDMAEAGDEYSEMVDLKFEFLTFE